MTIVLTMDLDMLCSRQAGPARPTRLPGRTHPSRHARPVRPTRLPGRTHRRRPCHWGHGWQPSTTTRRTRLAGGTHGDAVRVGPSRGKRDSASTALGGSAARAPAHRWWADLGGAAGL